LLKAYALKASLKYGLIRKKVVNLLKVPVSQLIKLFTKGYIIYLSLSRYINYQMYSSVSRNRTKRVNSIVKISEYKFGFIQAFYELTYPSCNCQNLLLLVRSFSVKRVKKASLLLLCKS